MKRNEIEFLRAAGFSIAEIMTMETVQNDEKGAAAPAGSEPAAGQNAQTEPAQPAAAPAQTDPAPAAPAPAQTAPAASADNNPAQTAPAASLDNNPAMTEILNKILAAIQSQNRADASIPTPEKKSPEEIAAQLY